VTATFILFSSGYPNVEGGKDPIGRFEKSLGDRDAQVRANFYTENLLRLFPDTRVHSVAWPTCHSRMTWIRLTKVGSI
jgi:hypothetical protein|tara:strand:+ start:3200 stop:3433 length:234 start_codon:yes stop_codon:yes gene_type:complete